MTSRVRLASLWFAAMAGGAPAQDPPAPPPVRPHEEIGQSGRPGGVDFGSVDAVQKELDRVKSLQSQLDPKLTADAERGRLLQRQIAVLVRQSDLLAQRAKLDVAADPATADAQAAAAKALESARAALQGFDRAIVDEPLHDLADSDAVAQVVARDFEQPATEARERAAQAAAACDAAAKESESRPREIDAEQQALAANTAEVAAIREKLSANGLTGAERAALDERGIVAEQELVHHRMRLQFLQEDAPRRERRLATLRDVQQATQYEQALRDRSLEAAYDHLRERRAAETRAKQEEVRQREQELAGSASAQEREQNAEQLETSRAEAEARAEAENLGRLEQRRTGLLAELSAAREQNARFLAIWRPEELRADQRPAIPPPRPDAATVARELDTLLEQTRYLPYYSDRRDLTRIATEAHSAAAAVALRLQELGATPEVGPRAARRTALEDLRTRLIQRAALAAELLDVRATIQDVRTDSLAILQSDNLLLRSASPVSIDALASGLTDLARLPAYSVEAAGRAGRWALAPGNLRSLLSLGAALLVAGVLLYLPHHWMARRIVRLLALDLTRLPVRTALLLANLVRTLCFATYLWIAPRLAATLLHGLPVEADGLLRSLGSLAALVWLGLGLTRELLRPVPASRMVLAIDPRTGRRVGAAVTLLLWITLAAVGLEEILTRLGWPNEGALQALDLAFNVVAGAIALLLLLRRSLLMSLLPDADRPLGRFVRRAVALIHPALVLLVPTIVVMQALGYRIFASFVTRLGVILLAAFPLGSIAYHAVVFFLERWRDRTLSQSGGDEAAEARIRGLDEIARFLLRIVIVVLLFLAVFHVTGTSPAKVRRFFEKPLPLQDLQDTATIVTWWNVLMAVVVAYVALRGVRHLRIALAAVILPATGLARSTQYTITTLVIYVIAGFGLWLAVSQVVEVRNLGYLVAALSVGIGFGLQEIIANFVSGLILLFERPIKIGDVVELGSGPVGTVRDLGIRATTIQTADNIHVLVPNREIITQRVANFDAIDARIRLTIDVGVAYGAEPKLVRDVLLEVAERDGRVLKRPPPEVFFTAFGDSSLTFMLVAWVDDSRKRFAVSSDLRFAIEAAFKRNSISIPYPQRDVALRAERPLRVIVERGTETAPDAPAAASKGGGA